MASGSTILQRRAAQRKARREDLRPATRRRLAEALRELLPGERVVVFGSLTKPGQFHEGSDIDLAIFEEPHSMTIYGLIAGLEDLLLRPADVILLEQSRFKDKILREGETWTS